MWCLGRKQTSSLARTRIDRSPLEGNALPETELDSANLAATLFREKPSLNPIVHFPDLESRLFT